MASKNIQLPELGEGVTEGELVKWLVKPGDQIEADQAVAEMMTDKATVEVPSPSAGVVKDLKAQEGDVVEVGQILLVLDSAGAAVKEDPAASKTSVKGTSRATGAEEDGVSRPTPSLSPPMAARQAQARTASAQAVTAMDVVQPPPADVKVLATPATRRLARESGIDINSVQGTGVAGRVTRDDVMRSGAGAVSAGAPSYQTPPAPRPSYQGPPGAAEERVALKGIRKKIAENMQMAKHIIPHFTLMDEANVTALVKMREGLKSVADKSGAKITYLPFVMKALIATAREFPMFNASIDDAAQEIVYKKSFNVGFAADTPSGLLVPVIKSAEQKTILQLSKEISDLAKRARDGKLALDEMRGATITITNIGSVGGTYATPIINHPEVAILGMYKIQDKPVIKQGGSGMEIDVIKTMNFTITADHRLIDGAVAGNFLKAFIARLENPGLLMLDMI